MFENEVKREGKSMERGVSCPRVLLVDDNESLLQILKEFLEQHEMDVIPVAHAGQALEVLENTIPDIIVSDVMMPEVDGYQFHKKVRDNERWCSIPFVYLSALSGEKEVCTAKALGCDDYLPKPFSPDELLAVIKGKLALHSDRSRGQQLKEEASRKRIINTLSHELRTPLVAINTGTELLLEQGEELPREKIGYLLETIQRGGLRLQRLIEDFMLVQQIDNGVADKVHERYARAVPVSEIISLALETFTEFKEIFKSEVEVRCEWAEQDVPMIEVYAIQVADALYRLVANASKFSPDNSVVQVCCREEAGNVVIEIVDCGRGLSEEQLEMACERFSQIERDKYEQQGCGLGLPLASYFTTLNGGEIQFENRESGGLIVRLSFPVSL